MNELIQKYINKVFYTNLKGLEVKVVVMDLKKAYNKTRFLVSPVTGKGQIWVESIY